MKGLGKFLSETLFPVNFTCDICGIETFETNICDECLKTIEFNNKTTCPVCGRKTVRAEICYECKARAPLFKKGVSALIYRDGAAALIKKFKNGNGYLKEYFADLLAEKVKQLPTTDCIVYVPMTEKAVIKRGYNQGELLAKSLSSRLGIPVLKNAVVKVKDTSEQKSLSQKERLENLKGCFSVKKRNEIKDKNILLVDDVLTTGATAETVCRKLLKAGAAHVYLATVASVEFKLEKKV